LDTLREGLATIHGAPLLPDAEAFLNAMSDRKPWYSAEYVKQKFEGHGFQYVLTEIMPGLLSVENVTTFVQQLMASTEQYISKFWSEEVHANFSGKIWPALLNFMTEKYPDGQAFELANPNNLHDNYYQRLMQWSTNQSYGAKGFCSGSFLLSSAYCNKTVAI
jgi:hypothetical protein